MTTTINDKYLHALSLTSDWLTVSEWACKVTEVYPDLLVAADASSEN